MRRIWRYALPETGAPKADLSPGALRYMMPMAAEPLAVDFALGTPSIWFLVDDHEPLVERVIDVVPTGYPAWSVERENYVGSYVTADHLRYHVFVRPQPTRALGAHTAVIYPADPRYQGFIKQPFIPKGTPSAA